MPRLYQFGSFALNEATRRLIDGDTRNVALGPIDYEIFLKLISNRHRAVSRSELIAAGWTTPEADVREETLNQHIHTLRKKLRSGNLSGPQYIERVSVGYFQFTFEPVVERDAGEGTGNSPDAGILTTGPTDRRIPLPSELVKSLSASPGRVAGCLCGIPHMGIQRFVNWASLEWPRLYRLELKHLVPLRYKGQTWLLPQRLLVNNAASRLRLSDLALTFNSEPFHVPPNVKALTEESAEAYKEYCNRNGRSFFNGETVRVRNLTLTRNATVRIECQLVYFFENVASNLVLDALPPGKESLRTFLLYRWPSRLPPLHLSPLADLLRLELLLFTADGSLILQQRSHEVGFRGGELYSSVAGGMVPSDIEEAKTLRAPSILREVHEQLGLGREEIALDAVTLLGVTRELIAGGEVDIYCAAKTNLTERDIRDRWQHAKNRWSRQLISHYFGDEPLTTRLKTSAEQKVFRNVDRFLDAHIGRASVPLLTAIALWAQQRSHIASVAQKSRTNR